MKNTFWNPAVLLGLLALAPLSPSLAASTPEEETFKLKEDWLETFDWRSIGPASMGGRCIAIAVSSQNKNTYWIATASGGLLKTTNAGTTYTHQFDHESSVSIGHVAVAPSDEQVLWVGTGEANPRNSVSYGDGVYKSVDGGETWKRMGLEKTFQIGRIAIHPENSDIVYVGALGRLYGSNEERGLYKTIDGGENWEKILYVDERTGVVDVDMHPTNPDILTVATYERERDGFDTNTPKKPWGPGSGIYRTQDAGATWTELTEGLPSVELGRIGIDYSLQNPDVLFAVVESERMGLLPDDTAHMGMSGEDADVGARITRVTKEGPADAAGFEDGDIVISMDGTRVMGYDDLLSAIRSRKAGDKAQVELVRERELMTIEVEFDLYEDGSRGLKPFAAFLGGQRENMQDSQGQDSVQTGGIYKSMDGGDSWEKVNSLNPRPMYYSQVRVDPTDEERIYILGTSFWMSEDGGETFERQKFHPGVHVDNHALWIDPDDSQHLILGNDGGIYVTHDRTKQWDHHNHVAIGQFYHVTTDQGELYKVYGGLQDNGSWGAPNRTRGRSGTVNADWFNIGGGDGFVCRVDPEDIDQLYSESQGGAIGWRNLRTGERGGSRPSGDDNRFNWETPFQLSNHNSRILYSAGNRVYRSLNRGRNSVAISPEITMTDQGSASAFAESHQDPKMLWVGSDDGALWMTKDGGDNWIDLRLPSPADGYPNPAERRTALLVELLASFDKDVDGKVQRKDVPETMQDLFDAADINGDKVIDSTESAIVTGIPEPFPADPLDGTWKFEVEGDAVPPVGLKFEVTFSTTGEQDLRLGKLKSKYKPKDEATEEDDKEEEAEAEASDPEAEDESAEAEKEKVRAESGSLRSVTFDESTQEFSFSYKSAQGVLNFSGKRGDGKLSGEFNSEGSDFKASFTAEPKLAKEKKPKKPKKNDKSFADVMPTPMWITGLEASRHKAGRLYLAVDGHRSDDDGAYAFVSEDEGLSWNLLTDRLPRGSVRCIREDLHNEDLLYLGTEFNAWISIDRGQSWTKVEGLPTVAIHEFAQSPATGDVVVGTHGRSLWAFDATALRQLNPSMVEEGAALMAPAKITRWRSEPSRAHSGPRRFEGENPTSNAEISYFLASRAKSLDISILGSGGEVLHSFKDPESKGGLHKLAWNMRMSRSDEPTQGRRRRGGRQVPLGTYQVRLSVDGRSFTQDLVIAGDPDYPELDGAREVEEKKRKSERDVEEYLGDH